MHPVNTIHAISRLHPHQNLFQNSGTSSHKSQKGRTWVKRTTAVSTKHMREYTFSIRGDIAHRHSMDGMAPIQIWQVIQKSPFVHLDHLVQ